jgi:hypothetical protein
MAIDFQTTTSAAQPIVEFVVPDSSGSFELPIGPGAYIAKLQKIEAAPEGEWGPQIFWYWEIFNTYDLEGKDVRPASYNADGSIWCYRERTSTKFGEAPNGGVKAKARERAEALLRRELAPGERLQVADLIGRPAVLHLIWKTALDGQKQYLNVAHIERYRVGMLAPLPPKEGTESVDLGDDAPPF